MIRIEGSKAEDQFIAAGMLRVFEDWAVRMGYSVEREGSGDVWRYKSEQTRGAWAAFFPGAAIARATSA